MSIFLRRCSHGASRRVLSALIWSDPTRMVSPSASAIIQQSPELVKGLLGCVPRREIHFSPGPLQFRATFATHAEFAVDELYDDVKKGDEGLEISKLGISDEIVSRLAKKGINKLFPIQVFFFWFYQWNCVQLGVSCHLCSNDGTKSLIFFFCGFNLYTDYVWSQVCFISYQKVAGNLNPHEEMCWLLHRIYEWVCSVSGLVVVGLLSLFYSSLCVIYPDFFVKLLV